MAMAAGHARRPLVPVNHRTVTDDMEQLQEGYVSAIAATAGCQVDAQRRGNDFCDLRIIRDGRLTSEETVVLLHLKCTTGTQPGHREDHFSFIFRERRHFDRLAMERSFDKHILVVMLTRKEQALWTDAGADHLKMFHCCYWVSLEGMRAPPGIASPTVHVPTANIFDADALTAILDRLERGEALR